MLRSFLTDYNSSMRVRLYLFICLSVMMSFCQVLIELTIPTGLSLPCNFAIQKHIFIVIFRTRPPYFKRTVSITFVNTKSCVMGYLCGSCSGFVPIYTTLSLISFLPAFAPHFWKLMTCPKQFPLRDDSPRCICLCLPHPEFSMSS